MAKCSNFDLKLANPKVCTQTAGPIKHPTRIAKSIVERQSHNRYCAGPDFYLMEGSCLEIV